MEMSTASIEERNTNLGAKLSEIFLYGKSMVPALLVLLAILLVFFGLMTPYFITYTNFKAIISNFPIIAIMAVGMTFVLLIGGLDISVGSILGFTAVNVAVFHNIGFPAWAIVLVCLVIGTLFGSFNGLIVTKVGINPVITTLGTMALARGMASWFALDIESLKVGRIFDQKFLLISRYYIPQDKQYIPITLIYIIVIFVGMSLVLKYTDYGRKVYAVGSNEYAARLAGINTSRIKFISYVMSGIMASIAGIVLVAQLSLGRDDAGMGSELEVITAVVLGGVSLAGGKGNLLGVIISVIILGVIRNGMVHLQETIGLSYYWREVVKGAILIFAISIDSARLMAIKKRQVVRQ
ncbi:MAG TPA: ABC transporter permease [Spirochaetes bacterium]|nr:ABC transporter permease [Spirochaetota bacterium]